MRSAIHLAFLIAGFCLAGCGANSNAPPKYELTGEVLFEGKPVPLGEIMFSPDPDKSNVGPSSLVQIRDGKFQTEPGKGHVGGPYTATLIGFDGQASGKPDPLGTRARGKILFRDYVIQLDLPRADVVQKLEVVAKK